MVEAFLASLPEPDTATRMPPILRSLRGMLKKADLDDYRKHLTGKHQ